MTVFAPTDAAFDAFRLKTPQLSTALAGDALFSAVAALCRWSLVRVLTPIHSLSSADHLYIDGLVDEDITVNSILSLRIQQAVLSARAGLFLPPMGFSWTVAARWLPPVVGSGDSTRIRATLRPRTVDNSGSYAPGILLRVGGAMCVFTGTTFDTVMTLYSDCNDLPDRACVCRRSSRCPGYSRGQALPFSGLCMPEPK